MINENDIDGTITMKIADYKKIIASNNVFVEERDKRDKVFAENKKVFNEGLVKYVLPYSGSPYYESPWNEGTVWMKPNEAIKEIIEKYEFQFNRVQKYTEDNISKLNYIELIIWKWRKRNESKNRVC